MDERVVTGLRLLAGVCVLVTAAFHLDWGLQRAIVYLQALGYLLSVGTLPDPRPFLFVLFGAALLAGPYLVTRDLITLRRGYQLGALVMLLSIAAWMGWHLTDHAAFLFPQNAATGSDATHTGFVSTIVEHYVTNPVEGAVKTVELVGAMAFGALWRWDPAIRSED